MKQADLYAEQADAAFEWLSLNGPDEPHQSDQLQYFPQAFQAEADSWYVQLADAMPWQQAEIRIAGQKRLIPRLQIWMGDPHTDYQYSGLSLKPVDWLAPVDEIKRHVENLTGYRFNSALLNYYRHGEDSVSWHADDEPELDATVPIASVSLGQQRRFSIKPQKHYADWLNRQLAIKMKTRQIDLQHGSLLVMMPGVQQRWQHAVLKQPGIADGRINLTFRAVNNIKGVE